MRNDASQQLNMEPLMSVTNHAPEYDGSIDRWKLVQRAVQGEEAIKKGRTAYLPMPNSSDESRENINRYDQYIERAQFVNFTGRTKTGLIGSVFRKMPAIDLPPQIEYLIDDASRNGISLKNLIKLSTGDVLEYGRGGLLADYPQAEEGLTLAETMRNRAYAIHYDALSIINWHVSQAGVLDLVVLREMEEVEEGPFNYVSEPRYRVLALVDGVYEQSYYDEGGQLMWTAIPRKSDGSVFDEIPFSWLGAEDNDETIDVPPLADIARVNVGHYRNSADYEESCFFTGQGTLHIDIGELSTEQFVQANPNGVRVGARGAIQTKAGKVEIVQQDPNTMPFEAMKHKEEQMIAIGARIIQDGGGAETAEAARIRHSGENSMLATVVENVEAAYMKVIGWIGEFMGVDTGEAEIKLNREFFDSSLSAQDVMAIIQLGGSGIVGSSDQRHMIRTGRISLKPERTDDEIDDEVAQDGGIGQEFTSPVTE